VKFIQNLDVKYGTLVKSERSRCCEGTGRISSKYMKWTEVEKFRKRRNNGLQHIENPEYNLFNITRILGEKFW